MYPSKEFCHIKIPYILCINIPAYISGNFKSSRSFFRKTFYLKFNSKFKLNS